MRLKRGTNVFRVGEIPEVFIRRISPSGRQKIAFVGKAPSLSGNK
ncbi:hypothetical protein FRUB_02278 [Fimbriiglobus ruber]|uniref:Uncharacterized protein n=1 Tax=Fimbriiglobus ruber TaxID=1908690 RepID=A0A225E2P1_9BACT|nr:hypothetical protein FRUB_02278 [Fimbriiglobus ruber]